MFMGINENTRFLLTYTDQIEYNIWLANEALDCFSKNT